MKYNGIINKGKFNLDTIVYNDTMFESPLDDDLKEIIKNVKGNIYIHNKGTNIDYPKNIDDTLYDITYICKDNVMYSEIDLNIIELTLRLHELKNKINPGYLNIFKSNNRVILK